LSRGNDGVIVRFPLAAKEIHMTRSTIFALMAIGLLTACAGKLGGPPPQPAMSEAYSDSIGFTGVGSERF
jgi:hypothetical protein